MKFKGIELGLVVLLGTALLACVMAQGVRGLLTGEISTFRATNHGPGAIVLSLIAIFGGGWFVWLSYKEWK